MKVNFEGVSFELDHLNNAVDKLNEITEIVKKVNELEVAPETIQALINELGETVKEVETRASWIQDELNELNVEQPSEVDDAWLDEVLI